MARSCFLLVLVFVVLFGGFSSTSATPPPAKIISGVVSNVVSALVKWLWSLKSTTKPAESSRSMMKFEGGYTVETVFDGSKLGIEPYSLDVSQGGEFLVLDSENSNIYKISSPLARYSRPKLVAGSPEGYTGHVDGWPREARLNHPKGLTVDDRGNIYIADTMNMAIRKIGDAGVTTIAGGKRSQVGGHVDGPGEDAKFSNDFDIVYIASSCSLLVIDRGNQAIREIQLHDDDCTYHYDGSFHLGIAVLVAAVFFGYMLALLQRRVKAMFSSRDDSRVPIKKGTTMADYRRPQKFVRPPLIPTEAESEKSEEGFFGSVGRLFLNTGSSVAEIFGGLFSGFRRKPVQYQIQQQYQQVSKHSNGWPMQESFVIPDEDEPPSLETRTPTAKRTYPFMTKDVEKPHNFKPSRPYLSGWDGDYQQQQQHHHMQQQQHHHKHYSSSPQTYYEQSCETNEIVFGAVQEQDSRRETMVIKAVDYGDPIYNHHNIRPRLNYYSHGY
ncbi:NHL domain-containing protein [Quillaja saponaria]|uniref:NHL domain-containing protein n=1 Tax=Quillaja saponaria TaxID=32244 RepID=A0AAD7VG86_QUISA|nr:NHL domain-containing protein [Quillaja saponaria]